MSSVYSVLAFDPGGKSGWARFDVDDRCLYGRRKVLNSVLDWDWGVLLGPENDQVRSMIHMSIKLRDRTIAYEGKKDYVAECAVVSESFIPRKMSQQEQFYSPMRINAKLDYQLWLNGIELHLQQPSLALGSADLPESDREARLIERLRRWGYYVPQKDGRAAIAHALTWLRRVSAAS